MHPTAAARRAEEKRPLDRIGSAWHAPAPAMDAVTGSGLAAIRKAWALLDGRARRALVWIVAFALASSLLEVATATAVVLFAQVLNQPETGLARLARWHIVAVTTPRGIVLAAAVVLAVCYVAKNLLAVAEVFHQNFVIQRLNYDYRKTLLDRYTRLDYAFHLTRNSVYNTNVVAGDTDMLFTTGISSLASIFSESLVFIVLTGLIVAMNPALALLTSCVALSLGLAVRRFLLPLSYRWGLELRDVRTQAGQHLLEFFQAFKEIVLLGQREHFIEAYQRYARRAATVQALQSSAYSLPRLALELGFVILFVLTVSLVSIGSDSPRQALGILSGYLYAGFRLIPGLNRIIAYLNAFKSVVPNIDRLFQEVSLLGASEGYADVSDFEFRRSVDMEGVTFRYPGSSDGAVRDVSLSIARGECVGIVGETGSGKSTLADLLLGLLRPQEGVVRVDGRFPVCALQWHRLIGYVPQSVYLTDSSIESNIAFGVDPAAVDQTLLWDAIDGAQLRRFVESLPGGVRTSVGEFGARLSGGERQRIAIARALYRRPEVLVFDEATSALDNETEARLMATIDTLRHDRTVIMIAHRITTLRGCDRIVVMKEGRSAREVSYQELAAGLGTVGENA